ncbi:potassium channel family protein, partial [Thermodesulfobacteriota bacterium]
MIDLRFRLKILIVVLLFVLTLGTLGFIWVEDLSPIDAFYFTIVTIATVGYGDIHPASGPGKAMALVLIICGVGTFLGVIANATEMIMNRREKQNRMEKTQVVLGAFFSKTGTRLLFLLSRFDSKPEAVCGDLDLSVNWSSKTFLSAKQKISIHNFEVDARKGDLIGLRDFLDNRGDALFRLLENPALMEHESFTELL